MPGFDHRSAKNGSSTTSDLPAQLGCTDDHGLHGIEPDATRETTRRLKLLAIQKARPPLSQSLWPARLPKEGERGASRRQAILKGERGEERWGSEPVCVSGRRASEVRGFQGVRKANNL
jgi:hypothetical protein